MIWNEHWNAADHAAKEADEKEIMMDRTNREVEKKDTDIKYKTMEEWEELIAEAKRKKAASDAEDDQLALNDRPHIISYER
jgi:hypothetical protein